MDPICAQPGRRGLELASIGECIFVAGLLLIEEISLGEDRLDSVLDGEFALVMILLNPIWPWIDLETFFCKAAFVI